MLTTVEPQIVGTNEDGSLKIVPRHEIELPQDRVNVLDRERLAGNDMQVGRAELGPDVERDE